MNYECRRCKLARLRRDNGRSTAKTSVIFFAGVSSPEPTRWYREDCTAHDTAGGCGCRRKTFKPSAEMAQELSDVEVRAPCRICYTLPIADGCQPAMLAPHMPHACNDHPAFVSTRTSRSCWWCWPCCSFCSSRAYPPSTFERSIEGVFMCVCMCVQECARFACANSTCKVPQYQPRPNSDVEDRAMLAII